VSDPQVAVVELVGVGAVDRVLVVTDHRPLLKSGSLGTLERDPATVSVAQMVNLKHIIKVRNLCEN
jgi:hypothetical protein